MKNYSFNQNASPGFIEIFSLQAKLAKKIKDKSRY
jgi:hypothetical protein